MEDICLEEYNQIFNDILLKKSTICETCDNIFDYVPQKRFCSPCLQKRRKARVKNYKRYDASATVKRYYEKNKEKILKRKRELYHKNKGKRTKEKAEYYLKNKERISIQKKEYYLKKKEGRK